MGVLWGKPLSGENSLKRVLPHRGPHGPVPLKIELDGKGIGNQYNEGRFSFAEHLAFTFRAAVRHLEAGMCNPCPGETSKVRDYLSSIQRTRSHGDN